MRDQGRNDPPAGNPPAPRPNATSRRLFGLTRLLQTPAINVLLSGVEKRPEVTLSELLTFGMSANNLRFGVASSPRQQEVNTTLFPLLAKARDEAAASLARTETKVESNGVARPSEFFDKMPLEVLDRKPGTKPVPPPPLLPPSECDPRGESPVFL